MYNTKFKQLIDNKVYLEPDINIFDTYSDFQKHKTSQDFSYLLDKNKSLSGSLFGCYRLMILAEPGFGKTTLLKQLIIKAKESAIEAIYLDLKRINTSLSIFDNIQNSLNKPDVIKTEVFDVSDKANLLICLDAFDEISAHNYYSVVDKITEFVALYPKVKIFITCRTLHYEKYAYLFRDIKLAFLKIYPFSYNDVFKYLNENLKNADNIKLIDNLLEISNYRSIIHTPRYLELFVEYINEKGPKGVEALTRCTLIEHFIDSKLNKERRVLNKIEPSLMKRVLETLALVMEIYQVNQLSKDELMSFFGDIQNDLKINILSHITIEEFIDKSILKDNIDYIEFENTEFQEYMAAKEMSRFKDLKQSVFDLAVNPALKEIYPSWFNLLTFLIELDIKLLDDILGYGMNNNGIVADGYFNLITKVNYNLLDTDIRDKIFKQVFEYHQTNNLYCDFKICDNLSYYYTSNNLSFLKTEYETIANSKIPKNGYLNIYHLIYCICKRNTFREEEILFWTTRYENLTKHGDPDTIKGLLFVAKYLNNTDIVDALLKMPYQNDEELWKSVINSLSEINVGDEVMVNIIVDGMKFDSSFPFYYLLKLRIIKEIKRFFVIANSDDYLIEQIHSKFSYHSDLSSLSEFIAHLEHNIDDELIKQLKIFIIKSCGKKIQSSYHSQILGRLINFVSKLDKNFIFELINSFAASEDYLNFMLPDIFSECLHLGQVSRFIVTLKEKIPKYPWLAFRTLDGFKYSKKENASQLFKEGRKYFKKEYLESKKREKINKEEDELRKRIPYEQFKNILDLSTDENYFVKLFTEYASNHNNIEEYLEENDRDIFKRYLTNYLKVTNPLTSGLDIVSESSSGTNYRVSSIIGPCGDAILCADKLNLSVEGYRQNIINYIPFAYHDHFSAINNLVDEITSQELEPLVNVYTDRSSDLWKFMPNNLFHILKRYNSFVPLFETVLVDYLNGKGLNRVDFYERTEALEILDNYRNDIGFIKDTILKFKESDVIYHFAKKLLISKYKDEESIKERVDEIIKRAFKFRYPKSAHTIDHKEGELQSKNFARPLLELSDSKYIPYFLKILEKSYSIQNKDDEYFAYATYMREIVISFYDNLKKQKDISVLYELENFNKIFIHEKGFGYFLDKISQLKNKYLEFIGKPENIGFCILRYNKVKKEQYFEINNSWQLYTMLKDIIENGLNDWIKNEGKQIVKPLSGKSKLRETNLQKLIKLQLENLLLAKGFRKNDFYVYREIQNLDNTRTDFLVGYGFINPILIELKLSSNGDLGGDKLKSKKSYKSLVSYINILKVDYSIFLVYENQNRSVDKWRTHLFKINKAYSDIPNVGVVGLPF